VCTSLEEWAFLISKWMVAHAYNTDEESETRWNKASNLRPKVIISNIYFAKDVGHVPEMSATASLNANAYRFNNMPKK
jgi:hypothetical protein